MRLRARRALPGLPACLGGATDARQDGVARQPERRPGPEARATADPRLQPHVLGAHRDRPAAPVVPAPGREPRARRLPAVGGAAGYLSNLDSRRSFSTRPPVCSFGQYVIT